MALIITDRFPAQDASGVYINDIVWAQFSQELDADSATYYNFTVTERNTYDSVDGTVTLQGVSGNLDNAIIVFVPTNGFQRNTEYSILASTGLTNKTGTENLDHDDLWYFKTGNDFLSGNIGDNIYDLDPSGFTLADTTASGAISGATALAVLSTYPTSYSTNLGRALKYIAITFNGPIPSGTSMYEHLRITSRNVLN